MTPEMGMVYMSLDAWLDIPKLCLVRRTLPVVTFIRVLIIILHTQLLVYGRTVLYYYHIYDLICWRLFLNLKG